MKKRSPVAILVLSFVTFGLYPYYWLYATSQELRRESGREDISPLLDAFLALITLGVWGVWAGYRNAKLAHELLDEQGVDRPDRAIPVAAAGVASYFLGPWTWLVAMILLQEELNELEESFDYLASAREARPEPSRRSPRVRVDANPPAAHEPAPGRSDALVFESSAPAPNAY